MTGDLEVRTDRSAPARDRATSNPERIRDERRALQEFIARIEALDGQSQPRLGRIDAEAVLCGRSTGEKLDAVRRAYEETVLSLPHRSDEPYLESVARCLGPDIAAAIGEAPRLQPTLQRTLMQAARQARAERTTRLERPEKAAGSERGETDDTTLQGRPERERRPKPGPRRKRGRG